MLADIVMIDMISHPNIFKAFEVISNDMGSQAGHLNYAVPMKYKASLDTFENILASLNPQEFNDFCIGELTPMTAIAQRGPAHQYANDFLTHFSDYWTGLTP